MRKEDKEKQRANVLIDILITCGKIFALNWEKTLELIKMDKRLADLEKRVEQLETKKSP